MTNKSCTDSSEQKSKYKVAKHMEDARLLQYPEINSPQARGGRAALMEDVFFAGLYNLVKASNRNRPRKVQAENDEENDVDNVEDDDDAEDVAWIQDEDMDEVFGLIGASELAAVGDVEVEQAGKGRKRRTATSPAAASSASSGLPAASASVARPVAQVEEINGFVYMRGRADPIGQITSWGRNISAKCLLHAGSPACARPYTFNAMPSPDALRSWLAAGVACGSRAEHMGLPKPLAKRSNGGSSSQQKYTQINVVCNTYIHVTYIHTS